MKTLVNGAWFNLVPRAFYLPGYIDLGRGNEGLQNIGLGFIFKFIKFRTFEPRYSILYNSYTKKECENRE